MQSRYLRKLRSLSSKLLIGFIINTFGCALFNTNLQAFELVHIGFGQDKPPYVINEESGLEIDLVKAAFATQNTEVVIRLFPRKTLYQQVKKRLDGASSLTTKENDGLFYSTPYLVFFNVLVTKTESHIIANNVDDLAGLRISSWQGASHLLGPELQHLIHQNHQIPTTYHEVNAQTQQISMLLTNRADALIIDRNIFRWYWLKLPDTDKFEYNIHQIFPRTSVYQAAFRTEELRDRFNAGLIAIRNNGTYDAIWQSYFDGETSTK